MNGEAGELTGQAGRRGQDLIDHAAGVVPARLRRHHHRTVAAEHRIASDRGLGIVAGAGSDGDGVITAGVEHQRPGDAERAKRRRRVARRQRTATLDRHRGRIDAAGAGERAAVAYRDGRGAVGAVEYDSAGIDIHVIEKREFIAIGVNAAGAEIEIERAAAGADDIARNGAAGDVDRVGMRRELDCAGNCAGGLIDGDGVDGAGDVDRGCRRCRR